MVLTSGHITAVIILGFCWIFRPIIQWIITEIHVHYVAGKGVHGGPKESIR